MVWRIIKIMNKHDNGDILRQALLLSMMPQTKSDEDKNLEKALSLSLQDEHNENADLQKALLLSREQQTKNKYTKSSGSEENNQHLQKKEPSVNLIARSSCKLKASVAADNKQKKDIEMLRKERQNKFYNQ